MDSPYSPLEFALLNDWQRDFPLVPRPFAEIAAKAGADEPAVLAALTRLRQRGAVSRIGAVFAPRRVGASTLAAIAAPAERVEEIAELISAHAEVNHNYQREHELNLWFVAAADDEPALGAVLASIEQDTGCHVMSLPLEREYHIDLGFDLSSGHKRRASGADAPARELDLNEKRLIAALAGGIHLVERPFRHLGEAAAMTEEEVIACIAGWLGEGMVKRFGVVVRHHELGYRANAMVVFDVADAEVDRVGERLAAEPGVTLCYRRSRHVPRWPYNLYCMVHGRSRAEAMPVIERLARVAGAEPLALFSTRRFKQCGARYFAAPRVGADLDE